MSACIIRLADLTETIIFSRLKRDISSARRRAVFFPVTHSVADHVGSGTALGSKVDSRYPRNHASLAESLVQHALAFFEDSRSQGHGGC